VERGGPISAVVDSGMEPLIPEKCCDLPLDEGERGRLEAMFKAMGNPHRFQIMEFLLTHPGAILAEFVKQLPIAQATVSQHMKVLREAGWVSVQTIGTATYYRIDCDNVEWFKAKTEEILDLAEIKRAVQLFP